MSYRRGRFEGMQYDRVESNGSARLVGVAGSRRSSSGGTRTSADIAAAQSTGPGKSRSSCVQQRCSSHTMASSSAQASSSTTPSENRAFERWRQSLSNMTGLGMAASPAEGEARQVEVDRAAMERDWSRCERWKNKLMTGSTLAGNRLRSAANARPDDRVHAKTPRASRLPLRRLGNTMPPLPGNHGGGLLA